MVGMILLPSSPTGRLRGLVRSVANQANKYTLGTWIPSKWGTGAINVTGTTEGDIRPPAAAAFGLAAALGAGAHDPAVTGWTESAARARTVELVDAIAVKHTANGGGWGGIWQAELWAWLAGHAAWLLWDDLTATQRTRVENMLVSEANRILTVTPRWNNTGGDTWLEEGMWQLAPAVLATVMLPNHANAASWMQWSVKAALAASAMPADDTSPEVVNGVTLSSWIAGYNILADGSVRNHNLIHPDYFSAHAHTGWSSLLALVRAGQPVPRAMVWNGAHLWDAFTELVFPSPPYNAPGGTVYTPGSWAIYYPEGTDWGTSRIVDKAMMDVAALALGLTSRPEAARWGLTHWRRARDMQARGTTGQTYQPGDDDTYAGREQWVAHITGCALLFLESGPVTFTNDPV